MARHTTCLIAATLSKQLAPENGVQLRRRGALSVRGKQIAFSCAYACSKAQCLAVDDAQLLRVALDLRDRHRSQLEDGDGSRDCGSDSALRKVAIPTSFHGHVNNATFANTTFTPLKATVATLSTARFCDAKRNLGRYRGECSVPWSGAMCNQQAPLRSRGSARALHNLFRNGAECVCIFLRLFPYYKSKFRCSPVVHPGMIKNHLGRPRSGNNSYDISIKNKFHRKNEDELQLLGFVTTARATQGDGKRRFDG